MIFLQFTVAAVPPEWNINKFLIFCECFSNQLWILWYEIAALISHNSRTENNQKEMFQIIKMLSN